MHRLLKNACTRQLWNSKRKLQKAEKTQQPTSESLHIMMWRHHYTIHQQADWRGNINNSRTIALHSHARHVKRKV